MNNEKNFTAKEAFDLALKNHQNNNLQDAQNYYNRVLKIDPNHTDANNNLGIILQGLGENQKAKECFEKVIEINPNYSSAHNNLGIIYKKSSEYQKAISCYEKAIKINPNYLDAHFNLGLIFQKLDEHLKAKNCYKKMLRIDPNNAETHYSLGVIYQKLKENQKAIANYEKSIEINTNYALVHYNLGIIYKELSEYQKAISCYEKAIEIDPNFVAAHNNLGAIFDNMDENKKAKDCYEKVIEIDPNFAGTYWNLHGTASDIDEALSILKKLYEIDNKHTKAKILIAALEGYKGNFNIFNDILKSSNSNHPYTRSINWVFSLPKLPKIYFNRHDFFDAVIKLADNSRPFYEFGVWNGISFQYLINTFKKGFGFDTFSGIPEDWHEQPKGSYSSFGVVPKIAGGEFIVGKFEDTLDDFFSKERPMASLINFDADLYSSTLCALNYSNKVIDDKTILVFDELILNNNWEEDEFRALNEFCDNLGYIYEVVAISFVTMQVAIKLKK